MYSKPLIGISANVSEPHADRGFYQGKRVEFAEARLIEWVVRCGGVPMVVPVLATVGLAAHYAEVCDGLLLAGGGDLAPESFGEIPMRPEWAGEPERDAFEFAALRAFMAVDKPVLGVCRGHQLLNVAFGGTLFQDLEVQQAQGLPHKVVATYDANHHVVNVVPDGRLAAILGRDNGLVSSVHHQAIRKLAPGLRVLATSEDGLIEALEHPQHAYVLGVQWHPEWTESVRHAGPPLEGDALMTDFLAACATRVG